jgi:chromosome segregation ATPase
MAKRARQHEEHLMANMKSLAAANKEIARLHEQISGDAAMAADMHKLYITARDECETARRERDAARNALSALKAEHAKRIVEIATLRGYLRRAHEDDEIRDGERGLRREVKAVSSIRADPTFEGPSFDDMMLASTVGNGESRRPRRWFDF